MNWLIVSDIFGRTDALEGFASSLEEEYSIIDPYEGKRNRFADEESAYCKFSNEVGLDRYFKWY